MTNIIILNFSDIFSTEIYVVITTLIWISPELDGVPSACLYSYHTAAGGLHLTTLAVGLVHCPLQFVSV